MSLREFARYRSRSHGKKRHDRSRSESSSPSTSSSCGRRRQKRKHLKKAERKDRHTKKHKKDVKHKRKKRTRSESSSSSDSDNFEKRKKKSKHKLERKKKKKKRKEKKSTKEKQVESKDNLCQPKEIESSSKLEPEINEVQGPAVNEMDKQPHKRSMAPMTKAEYEKQQSKIRRVYDPETGRNRLIKGDGEVIEEIVSYDRHKLINQMATHGDGVLFQANQQKEMFS